MNIKACAGVVVNCRGDFHSTRVLFHQTMFRNQLTIEYNDVMSGRYAKLIDCEPIVFHDSCCNIFIVYQNRNDTFQVLQIQKSSGRIIDSKCYTNLPQAEIHFHHLINTHNQSNKCYSIGVHNKIFRYE